MTYHEDWQFEEEYRKFLERDEREVTCREDWQFEEEYRKIREWEEFKACMPEFVIVLLFLAVMIYSIVRHIFG